jgi:hypothetical protein
MYADDLSYLELFHKSGVIFVSSRMRMRYGARNTLGRRHRSQNSGDPQRYSVLSLRLPLES